MGKDDAPGGKGARGRKNGEVAPTRYGELPLQCRLATLELLQGPIKAFAAPALGKQAQCHDTMDDGQDRGIKDHWMKEPPQQVAKEGGENRQSQRQNPVLAEHRQALAAISLQELSAAEGNHELYRYINNNLSKKIRKQTSAIRKPSTSLHISTRQDVICRDILKKDDSMHRELRDRASVVTTTPPHSAVVQREVLSGAQ